jgi:hypothetical protein
MSWLSTAACRQRRDRGGRDAPDAPHTATGATMRLFARGSRPGADALQTDPIVGSRQLPSVRGLAAGLRIG